MPQLTEELWNKLWKAQNEREAARREELRQAVAKSIPPLTADLVQALIHLNDQYTREIMREHKGFTLAERRTSYLTRLAIMEQCLQDLLAAICAFEAAALAEDSTLFDRNGDVDLKRFERTIQKELFATISFAVCLTIGDGLLTFFVALIWKAKAIGQVPRNNLTPALLAGGMQVGSYWIIIVAMAFAPLGMVSALRETSVLFAALISTFILKEGFGVWRFVSAGMIACGIGLTRYRS